MQNDELKQDAPAELQEVQHDELAPVADAVVAEKPIEPDEPQWMTPRADSTTVRQDMEVMSPLDKPWDETQLLLALPSETEENIAAALSARPNINIADTKQGGDWLNTIRTARMSVSFNGMLNAATTRIDSAFRQGVQSEKGILTAGNVRFKDAGDAKLTGERAVLRVRALTGMGSVIRVPLWHSGFWISLKAPSDAALLELNRTLTEEKITLGRSTFGLAFANMSAFFASWVMNFALSHVYDSTLHPEIEGNLRSYIQADDIPLIAWGLACVCWPGGFPYARSVLDPEAGEKIIREKLNIGKLLWVDNAALTPWQVSHMSKLHGQTMTAADIDRYRKEFTRGQGRVVELAPQLKITLRSPTMDQYLNAGHRWVNNIVRMVDEAFSRPENDTVRDQYIFDQGKATNMRQYVHFVERINAGDDIIDDEATIEEVIDALSSDDEIRKKYFKAVKDYIADSMIAVVAIPATEKEDRSVLPRFPHLLALDVLSVFFILLVQKIPQIQAR